MSSKDDEVRFGVDVVVQCWPDIDHPRTHRPLFVQVRTELPALSANLTAVMFLRLKYALPKPGAKGNNV